MCCVGFGVDFKVYWISSFPDYLCVDTEHLFSRLGPTYLYVHSRILVYSGRAQDGEELDIFYSWTTMEMNRNDHLRLLIFTIAINLAPVLFFISLPAFEGHDHGHRHHLPRDYELPNIIIISQSIFIKTSSTHGLICGTIILKPSDCSHFVAVVLVGNFE